MSLQHAILGFLQIQPMTGYDLKTSCFNDSISHFWPADQAQIYRTLDKLAEQGLVESKMEYQDERPNRKVYSITQAGRAELAGWLKTEQALPIHREPFLVQLFFAGQLPNTDVRRLMKAQMEAHQALLTRYEQIAFPDEQAIFSKRELHFQKMTLELGLRMEHMYLDWLEECMKILDTL